MFKKTKLKYVFIFFFSLLALFTVLSVPSANAANIVDSLKEGQICVPDEQGTGTGYNIARCVNNIYIFSVALGGFAAVLMFVIAGYMYSVGTSSSIKQAREIIEIEAKRSATLFVIERWIGGIISIK